MAEVNLTESKFSEPVQMNLLHFGYILAYNHNEFSEPVQMDCYILDTFSITIMIFQNTCTNEFSEPIQMKLYCL